MLTEAFEGYAMSQCLREDDDFVLARAIRLADSVPVLLLRARRATPHSLFLLEHEYALRAELDAAWAAVPLALLRGAAPALVLSDGGGTPLSAIVARSAAAPMPPARFLALATATTQALVHLHARDIVHKHLCPEHLLIDDAGVVRLTGLGNAARLRALPHAPELHISGSLAYMAPEQTGRMNRPIDTRTDLYSLGVLLYRALCGELPFAAADTMHWIHCHAACEPRAPAERWPGIDPVCSAIVLKLLSKSAEQRYQTAAGLLADLRQCVARAASPAHGEPFVLARADGAARVQLPGRLVGRSAQLALLEEAVCHVAAGGKPELVMVAGHAGTGKTALLAALQRSDSLAGAIVVNARFERHPRETPYATLALALRAQVRRMLGEGEAVLAPWRLALRQALGADAWLVLDLVPELRLAIGEQPAARALPAREAEGRLQAAFSRFIGVFADGGTLLLLCLDDVQWIDPASLKLMTHLVTHAGMRRVLVVGAYRSNEVGASHPLALARDAVKRSGAILEMVALQPLDKGELGQLVGAVLGCAPDRCAPLAALVFAKTAGNPFFTLQFLAQLVEGGLLRPSGTAGWSWDAAAIGARACSDNVIDLMIARLQQLPYNTLELVKLLACLGREAELDVIAHIAGMSALETDECLWPAARLGLVTREPAAYSFIHDRVHEAAYSLIAPASLAERHLHIGRLLEERLGEDAAGSPLFRVASHLNLAQAAMSGAAELRALARLNSRAGASARAAIAYDAARHHYRQAVALTPERAWLDEADATFALYAALAEIEYLCGHLEQADSLYALLDAHARSRLELAQVAILRLALYQVWGRFDLAVTAALEALALFGVSFPQQDDAIADALAEERAAVVRNMEGRSIAGLADEQLSADPEIDIVAELFAEMGSSVFSARPGLYPVLAMKSLNFTLRFGSGAASSITYSRYAILLVSLGAVPDAFAFSELALQLAARDASAARRIGRLRFVHAAYVHPWRQPLAQSVEQLEQAFLDCQEAGDLPHAGYAAHIATWSSFEAGATLYEVQRRARRYQSFARQQNNEVLMQLLRCYEQLALCLQGMSGAETGIGDDQFNTTGALAAMDKASFGAARARCHLMRQVAAFTFGRLPEALQAAEDAAAEQHFFLASVNESTHHFYHALTIAGLYPELPRARQEKAMQAMLAKQEKLRGWAVHCAANFEARHLLVGAEIARLEGRTDDAARAYDGALKSARAAGFVHNEALAAELAAAFYHAAGSEKLALAYAREAADACVRWGAHGKVRTLAARYPAMQRP